MKPEVCTVAGLALLAVAATAGAQPAQRQSYPIVGINGYPKFTDPSAGVPEPMRRVAPADGLFALLPKDDPSVAYAKTAQPGESVMLDLAVDYAGKVVGCELWPQDRRTGLGEGLCERVAARARFRPAIDETGIPVPDRYIFHAGVDLSWKPMPAMVGLRPPSPVMIAPTASWPPNRDFMTIRVDKLDQLPGGPDSPLANAAPWTGVLYAPEAQGERCRVLGSSGDPAFDRRACAAAANGRYSISPDTPPNHRGIQLHFVLVDGKPRALVPVQKWSSRAAAPEAVRAAVAAALPAVAADRLTLNVRIDPAGAPTSCRIETSSESDDADVAACAAARKAGPYVPAKDVFGRPMTSVLYDWNPILPATSP
ncbi:hypothetical protein [Caulobacter mirabilis]|uniref:hypothetical protein n=1 Tax=Caulobacter mirabilis TaxID=69666 RepID=UPI001FE27813|nr:hypothetical protein [Caulobacter mirabilis]